MKKCSIIRSRKGFYVGDPGYVLSKDVYEGVWGDEYEYKPGTIKDSESGLSFAVYPTAIGDGIYADDEGQKYPVDCGSIAVIPLELVQKQNGVYLGRVEMVVGRTDIEWCDGVFDIQLPGQLRIRIDTKGDDEKRPYV